MKFATKAVHAGHEPDEVTGAVMPPIYMTSTYAQEYPGETKGYDYTRAGNPNFTILEKVLASLEDAKHATVFSAGLGALTGLISMLSSGDKVVAIDGLYGGTYRLFNSVFNRYGIEFISITKPTPEALEEAFKKKPAWLFFETPTNPLLEIFDIASLAKSAKKHGVLTIVDNTFATPYFQNPLHLAADVVWHSTTKYIGGHSDVIGGVAITNNDKIKEALDFARKAIGLNPSPFDAWLLTRGVKTLALRMERHQQNALAVATFLESHPKVKKVYYPGLKSHPQHEIAKKQMNGFGGMVSVEFDLSLEETKKLISSFKLFTLAESLGGVESLVCHPAVMTHASIPIEERHRCGITDGLIRFSVGIEDAEDLIGDLKSVLSC
ncbi:MAG: PLP-dependent aspartate aminotransferase family protein [Parachlamydiaceae bacterium]